MILWFVSHHGLTTGTQEIPFQYSKTKLKTIPRQRETNVWWEKTGTSFMACQPSWTYNRNTRDTISVFKNKTKDHTKATRDKCMVGEDWN